MLSGGRSFVSSPPAFSNDAKRILVCTGNTVSVFSTSTGLQTGELEGHLGQVTAVIVVPASTPASKLLSFCWTASLDGTIKYWDFTAPELMRTISIQYPIHSMVIPSLLSPASEITEKLPDLFAYVCLEAAQGSGRRTDSLGLQIRKCNLTKSRLVRGVTLAEVHRPVCVAASTSGKFIGLHEKRKLRIWEIPGSDRDHVDYRKIRLHHTKAFTTLAFHPSERTVAAGDVTGRILVWRGVGHRAFSGSIKVNKVGVLNKDLEDRPGVRGDDDADSCTTWHWHSAPVNVLFFSPDGTHLYSGGREGVLVVWQLDTGKKKFLPRIGSPVLYYINSPDSLLSCISCADNRIHLLEMPSMKILQSISGIKPACSMETSERGRIDVAINGTAGMITVPTENYRVQFYSLFDDREISEVQICERNHHPGDEITIKVSLVVLSLDGCTMCTVESRCAEEGIGSLISLKFWACDVQSKTFTLSTLVYEPHREANISSLAFHPSECMAVSASYGGDFKIWVGRHKTSYNEEAIQNTGWLCHAVGSYKGKAMTAAAFSGDGSVLAVAAGNVITLWDPYRNILLDAIGDIPEPISLLEFIGVSDYLVSASHSSSPQLSIWSMSKLCRTWCYKFYVDFVTCSMDHSSFAVLARLQKKTNSTNNEKGVILIFNPESPVPLSMWFVSKAQGGGLSYVRPHPTLVNGVARTKTTDKLLVFINADHEYFVFNPHKNESSTPDMSCRKNFVVDEDAGRYGYTSMYGELPQLSLPTDQNLHSSVPSENSWKTIFAGPSHILPPLDKLCSDFLESLLERRSTMVE